MRRASVIAGALLCGCVRGEPPSASPGTASDPTGAAAAREKPESAVVAAEGSAGEAGAEKPEEPAGATRPADAAKDEVPPPHRRADDGRCDPTPKAGAPCRAGDGYCVLSWGEPGGYSEALWCREGRWQLEQERNLP